MSANLDWRVCELSRLIYECRELPIPWKLIRLRFLAQELCDLNALSDNEMRELCEYIQTLQEI